MILNALCYAAGALAFWAAWIALCYLPERRERSAQLRALTLRISALFGESAQGDPGLAAGDVYQMHHCSPTHDHAALIQVAWDYARGVSAGVGPHHRITWLTHPEFHIATEDGVRCTCILMRFTLRPILDPETMPT